MKKIIALTLSLLMLASLLAGCGTSAPADNDTASDTQAFTVGVCQLMVHESLDKATQGFIDALTADVEAAGKIVTENHLTTLMITHNMRDAITHGNRLIMLQDGHVVVDVEGEEKKKLTVEDLLKLFAQASGREFSSDRAILS